VNIQFAVAIAALTMTPVAARADSFSIAADARGFVTEALFGGTSSTGNYAAGNLAPFGEVRNFFQFSLPTFTGTVTSARLRLDAGTIALGQTSPLVYQITSLAELPDSTDDLPLLGIGTVYGARSFTSEDQDTLVLIDLNNAGIAALASGGTFLVSGRVTNAMFGSPLPQLVFGLSLDRQVFLDFDTATPTAGIPEPATWAMLISGFGLVGFAARRRRETAVAA